MMFYNTSRRTFRMNAVSNRFPRLFKEGTDFMRSIKSGVVKLWLINFPHPTTQVFYAHA